MTTQVFLIMMLLMATTATSSSNDDIMSVLGDIFNRDTSNIGDMNDRRRTLDLGDDTTDFRKDNAMALMDDEKFNLERFLRMVEEDPETVLTAKPGPPLSISPCQPCCTSGYIYAALNTPIPIRYGTLPGATIIHYNPATSYSCNGQVLIKVNFDKASSNPKCSFCQRQPKCGKVMLKVTLTLSRKRSDWLVNIGDSSTNSGNGGDADTQTNDAEFKLGDNDGVVYKSDVCNGEKISLKSFLSPRARNLTLYISNNHIALEQYPGGEKKVVCNKCFLALNGQADPSSGGVNEDIYIALNRVVMFTTGRTGHGVCGVRMSWECPVSYFRF